MPRWIRHLHRNDRGALGVLLLFVVFALLALIAMVWNTGEYAHRRLHVQNAADAAAHTAATWTTRTANLVSATNTLTVENASAETIWRAVRGTAQGIDQRLGREYRRIFSELQRIDTDRQRNNNRPQGPNPSLALRLDLLEQALLITLEHYDIQYAILDAFIAPHAPALAIATPELFRSRRAEIHDYQSLIVDLTPYVIEEQRQAIAEYFDCDVTLALPRSPAAPDERSRMIHAPVRPVAGTNVSPVAASGVSVPYEEREVWVRGGAWGAINCPPLNRQFHSRLSRDLAEGASFRDPLLTGLDDERAYLGTIYDQLLVPLDDDPPAVRNIYIQVRRDLARMRFEQRFARTLWNQRVAAARRLVLHQLGEAPQHVLATYGRYPVPEWARPAVYNAAYQHVYNDVFNRNYRRLYQTRLRALSREQPPVVGAAARAEAEQFARTVAEAGAQIIAQRAAAQWINRSWPYEIRPPQSPVPPPAGLTTSQRQRHFTLLAAAMTREETSARPVLPHVFTAEPRPTVAYAQAETFNWMEFAGGYGAGDRYDRRMPPRPWRVSTIGGWNWRPRLSYADGLGGALANNPEFERYFREAGVTRYDPDTLDILILH